VSENLYDSYIDKRGKEEQLVEVIWTGQLRCLSMGLSRCINIIKLKSLQAEVGLYEKSSDQYLKKMVK